MAIELVDEVLRHAPRPISAGEWSILVVVAEAAFMPDRATRARSDGDELHTRSPLSEVAWSKACQRLAHRGLEVRRRLGFDRRGNPVFAYPGRERRYFLPHLVPAPLGCRCVACVGFPTAVIGVRADPDKGGPSSDLARDEGGPASDHEGGPQSDLPGARADHSPGRPDSGPGRPDSGPPHSRIRVRDDDAHARDAAGVDPQREADVGRAAGHVTSALGDDPDIARAAVDAWLADRAAAGEPVERPAAYVESFVRPGTPGQLRKYLDRARRAAEPAPVPGTPGGGSRVASRELGPPCGQCDARPSPGPGLPHPPASERLVFDDDGGASPCPRCHPSAAGGRSRVAS